MTGRVLAGILLRSLARHLREEAVRRAGKLLCRARGRHTWALAAVQPASADGFSPPVIECSLCGVSPTPNNVF